MGLLGAKTAEQYFQKAKKTDSYRLRKKYYKKAMEMGYVKAMYEYADILRYSDKTEDKALDLYWQYYVLAFSGDTFYSYALNSWTRIWYNRCKDLNQKWGCGTMAEPWAEAMRWITEQAKKGNAYEQKCLAEFYAFGKFAGKDLIYILPSDTIDGAKALYWYERTIESIKKSKNENQYSVSALRESMENAINLLLEDKLIPQDIPKAMEYLKEYLQPEREWLNSDYKQCGQLAYCYWRMGDLETARLWWHQQLIADYNSRSDTLRREISRTEDEKRRKNYIGTYGEEAHYRSLDSDYKSRSSVLNNDKKVLEDEEATKKAIQSLEESCIVREDWRLSHKPPKES